MISKPYMWKYEDYSDWSRSIARNYTRDEIIREINKLEKGTGKITESHLSAIKKTTSMQSRSQARAQSGNVVIANYERKQAYKNALEIYDFYPEKTKEGIKKKSC